MRNDREAALPPRTWAKFVCPECDKISRTYLRFGRDRYITCSYCGERLCVMFDADGITAVSIETELNPHQLSRERKREDAR